MQELDLETMQLTGSTTSLWDGAVKGNLEAEAPHLYKINGMYYLLNAEGGTSHNHAVSIARSQNITGLYQNNARNPILTHRHRGVDYPIACTGHAELVETQTGEWWLALLATRPYGGYYYNLGRETFLAPVVWEEGWPIVSPGSGRVEYEYPVPNLPEHRWPTQPACDNFEFETLAPIWNFLRTPPRGFLEPNGPPRIFASAIASGKISQPGQPQFCGTATATYQFHRPNSFGFFTGKHK